MTVRISTRVECERPTIRNVAGEDGTLISSAVPEWRNGRRNGLKHRRAMPVRVRVPPPVPTGLSDGMWQGFRAAVNQGREHPPSYPSGVGEGPHWVVPSHRHYNAVPGYGILPRLSVGCVGRRPSFWRPSMCNRRLKWWAVTGSFPTRVAAVCYRHGYSRRRRR